MSIHEEAAQFGIERPELEHYQYVDRDGVNTIALTPESESAWSDYLRNISLARIALTSPE